jgi:hypothetical protein
MAATPTAALVDWADVVGGFSTLFATLAAAVVIPVAILEARRQKVLGRLERLSTAVHSYLDRRPQFYDEKLVVNVSSEDDFEDVFENFYHVPQIDNMVGMVEFAVTHLGEIDKTWKDTHPSLVEMMDRDTKHLNGYIDIEAVSTYIADNACKMALEDSALAGVDALCIYDWDEIEGLDLEGVFPPKSYRYPTLNKTAWNKFIRTVEYRVRMKRRLLSGMYYRRNRRTDLRAELVKIDQMRAKLGLPQLPRNPEDMMEPTDAHG